MGCNGRAALVPVRAYDSYAARDVPIPVTRCVFECRLGAATGAGQTRAVAMLDAGDGSGARRATRRALMVLP
jgi:hypothetical protein